MKADLAMSTDAIHLSEKAQFADSALLTYSLSESLSLSLCFPLPLFFLSGANEDV